MANIGIIGAGSWGIALSYLLHNNGHQVTVWSALPQEVEELRKNRVHRTLPDLTLPEDMVFTGDLEAAMDQKDLLVTAVPSVYVRETAKKMRPFLREGQIVVNVAKGIEEGTLMTLSQILEEELPGANVAVLSGPSHAEEVSRSLPTTCVAGAADKKTAEYIQSLFMSEVFRVYTSPDVLGIELGGALKNVIALAAGIADGLGYGDNTKAALITRGIAEIARLGMAMGGEAGDFLRPVGDRRPDRDLRQHAQPQPQGWHPHRKRIFHGGGHEGGQDGGGGGILRQGSPGSGQKILHDHAHHRASESGAL